MQTFLDRPFSHSYLLWGKMTDRIVTADLMNLDLETYLVQLLKKNGYRHIVFYGTEGARGVYTIDQESARWYFGDNKSVKPFEKFGFEDLLKRLEQKAKSNIDKTEDKTDDNDDEDDIMKGAFGKGTKRRRCRGYHPHERQQKGEKTTTQTTTKQDSEPISKVRYSLKQMTPEVFVPDIRMKLRNRDDQDLAVIFYDTYNLALQYPSLLHDIIIEMNRMDLHNICLFMMENDSETAIVNRLRNDRVLHDSGFTDKFTVRNGDEYRLNESTTVHIGYPTLDEIVNYLRRLTLLGTSKGQKITFNYTDLFDIAKELQSCSQQYTFGRIPQPQTMREMMTHVDNYIHLHSTKGETLKFTTETIRTIYHTEEEKDYLEELNKEGWEEAYKVVKQAIEKYHVLHPTEQRGYSTEFAIERLSDDVIGKRPNTDIPNFVVQGPSGTGKSTIAEIIGKVLKQHNILDIGRFNELNKSELTDIYQNAAERYTREAISNAEESVLFIDEAESLADQDGGANNIPTGLSIIRTLNGALTSNQHHFSLIIAGYDGDMDKIFNLDQGFKSRFKNNIITLKDYDPELLMKIFLSKLDEKGGSVDPALIEDGSLLCLMSSIYHSRDRRHFGNGRVMETMAESIYAKCLSKPAIESDFYGLSVNDRIIDEKWFEDIDTNDSINSILNDLDQNYIGMKGVRQQLINLANRVEDAKANNRPLDEVHAGSIKLIGNPGTGKSEIGAILGRLYFQLGLTGTSQNVDCTATDLASQYVGAGIEKFKKYIDEAQSRQAMLFVDEASSLTERNIDGAGIVSALLAPTESATSRDNPLMCTVALYPNKEKEFDALNPGVSRRFTRIVIDDYSAEELFEIIKLMMRKNNQSSTAECDEELKRICEYVHEVNDADHRNAGEMKNILEKMNDKRIERCKAQGIDLASPEAKVYEVNDLPDNYMSVLPPKEESPLEVLEDIIKDINERYVGFDDVIEHLRDIAYAVNAYKEDGQSVFHMPVRPLIIAGNSGTGKSTLFDLMTNFYYRLHVISSAESVRISSDALMSTYQNGSKADAKKVIDEALSGNRLLLVDECHQLLNGADHATGKEVIQTFLAPIEDQKKPLRVIFAIYEKNLDQFLNLDPGFGNRFDARREGGRSRSIIHLHDYSGKELYSIFLKMTQSKGYHSTDELNAIVENYCQSLYEHRTPDSGNARQIKNLLDDLITMHNRHADKTNRKILSIDDLDPNIIMRYSPESKEQELDRLKVMLEQIDHERTGNKELKDVIKKIIKTEIFNKKVPQHAKTIEPGHYFFKGKPGAGKTTSVELLDRYLRELGILTRPYRTNGASDLVAGYVGQTALKTRSVLESGLGCITLIDEAYILANGSDNNFGKEAIAELVRFMDDEQYRRNSCLIFAGYPGEMDGLYAINPGLKSRIKEINFPDYSVEECIDIIKYMMSKDQLTVNNDAQEKINDIIKIIHEEKKFANGRTIRELYDAIRNNVENRLIETISDDDIKMSVTIEDIPSVAEIIKVCNLS
ncbi:MAG: AAA family ATPase [Erysipelotrichaceae bacterium]|nr:AAA family ATPase [Erysipelotrichaceae bacterium]